MSRTITAPVLAALQASNVPWSYLIQLDFVSGMVRLASAGTTIDWNGFQWVGAGRMLGVDAIRESGELEAVSMTVVLSSIPTEHLPKVLLEKSRGRPAVVYFAVLDANYAPLVNPIAIWSGRMAQPTIAMGQTGTIRIACESKYLAELPTPNYNDASQQAEYPGDLGFTFVEAITDQQIVWKMPDFRKR